MIFIIALILLFLSARLYVSIFKNKLSYLLIPDNIIAYRKKEFILKIHVLSSLIVSILISQQLNDYVVILSKINSDNFFALLVIFYIFSLLVVGYLIDILLKILNPQVAFINNIIENPILLEEMEHLKTDKLMDIEEFWGFINNKDFEVTPDEYINNLNNLCVSLEKYHPIKVVEFGNTLSYLRSEILSEELLEYYEYIWGRKYEENFYFEFIEFIIGQGCTKFNQVKLNPSNISNIDFNIYKLKNVTISSAVSSIYSNLVGRLFPFKTNEKENEFLSEIKIDVKNVKLNSQIIYDKYK